jgi:hypothetical protein
MILPTVQFEKPNGDPPEVAFHLTVTIAYQNLECHTHAFQTYESVTSRFVGTGEFKKSAWNFELLQNRNLRQLAVRDALEADIVIVCANETGSVDPGFSSWLQEWTEAKTNKPSAVVAIFVGSRQNPLSGNPLKSQLEAVAKKLGLDFFAKSVEEEKAGGNWNTGRTSWVRASEVATN